MADDFVPTRASLAKNHDSNDFTTVTFESYKSKKIKKNPIVKAVESTPTDQFNIRKVKHEVIKLGMSGFDGTKKEEAKVQLAIKLGAKPPKNKYKNYKVLMEERTREKKVAEEKSSFQQLGKNSVGKSTAKGKGFDRKRRKQGKGGLLDVYGKVIKKKT